MTRSITFYPSGRTCPIEASETVLQACLRAGLSPSYGCSNGNCGACRARLRSGEIEQSRHHDFTLTEPEKVAGGFLLCANRALSDLEVEADVTQGPEDIPVQDIDTKVKAVTRLDDQVMGLHLQTPRSRRLRFISGQSVTLEIGDGIRTVQAIASCPCDDRNIQFHIPDIPGDPFCERVFEGGVAARAGIRLRGPEPGAFFFDHRDRRHSLILCWHTGFAPIASLMEHAMSLEVEEDICLHRFSPTPGGQYLDNLCRSWSDAYDNISTRMEPERITLLSTVAACEAALRDVAARYADLSDFNIYVAGPPNFVAAAENVFGGRDQSDSRFRAHTDWLGAI